ncbi:hypothetical protein KEU06_09610 [Pseudaminobacter sp. 19-2017]|uniref:Putative DnaT-like domain-containing protein n=1 Tax=Pseudaminobacter soli (ex Zhang et al. 2022) TaxID=2831468 RepID=A0A942DXK5_9HYPH|nr:DnaT-like ssDNA-binding protein [Pseudaminobacter soli]MBS3648862.1 hypothetical protein [Pseudaminobacter soli]
MVDLVVEDGSIVAGANTYVDVPWADAYLAIDPHAGPIWAGFDDERKTMLLAYATRWIDENVIWYGRKVEKDQPLAWPRHGMHDGEYPVASTIIPEALKRAVALAAVFLHQENPTELAEAVGIKRFRNDTIEIEFQDGVTQKATPDWLSRLLRVFGTGPGDRGFKPITRVR